MDRCCVKPLILLLVFFGLWQLLQAEKLRYTLSIDEATFQYVKIEICVQETERRRLIFSLPNWIPGAYEWSEFGDNVISFAAQDSEGRALRFEKLSRSVWEVQPAGSMVRIEYLLKPSGRFLGTSLDSSGALLEGATTWMYVRDLEKTPIRVRLVLLKQWKISTSLPMDPAHNFLAASYDELVDSPILLGAINDTIFTVSGAAHTLSFRGEAEVNVKAFTEMVKKIVLNQSTLMEGLPYDHYVFQYLLSGDERGSSGLEHCNSTTIRLSALEVMQDVRKAANITSHEFFHLWNVKRITSAAFQPLHYNQEARTESLWWFEGVTSYYADLALVRSGVWSVEEFLKNQSTEIEQLQGNPDRLKTTLAQAGWRVWQTGLGGPGISYYNKGQLVGLLLDMMIRKVTRNEKSLDHVIRFMYHNYGAVGRGIGDDEFAAIVRQVTGKDFTPFFDRYVHGLMELPYQEIMAFAGLKVTIASEPLPSIGRLRILGPRNRVFSLDEASPAGLAGLRRNDLLLKADDQSFSGEQGLAVLLQKKQIGQMFPLLISRDGMELLLRVQIDKMEKMACTISIVPDPGEEPLRIRKSWLTGK